MYIHDQCPIHALLLWICLDRAESTIPETLATDLVEKGRINQMLYRPDAVCVYTDHTCKEPRNPSSGSVLEDRQP